MKDYVKRQIGLIGQRLLALAKKPGLVDGQSRAFLIFNYILVLLGFVTTTSCENINTEVVCMYGTPTMDFEVSGKVVNKDSAPIAGIKVSCQIFSDPGIPTTLTAADGSFLISGTAISPTLIFEDIDGPENGGEYEDKTQEISVSQVEKGDGSWYMGKYEAKDIVVKMEEKK